MKHVNPRFDFIVTEENGFQYIINDEFKDLVNKAIETHKPIILDSYPFDIENDIVIELKAVKK